MYVSQADVEIPAVLPVDLLSITIIEHSLEAVPANVLALRRLTTLDISSNMITGTCRWGIILFSSNTQPDHCPLPCLTRQNCQPPSPSRCPISSL